MSLHAAKAINIVSVEPAASIDPVAADKLRMDDRWRCGAVRDGHPCGEPPAWACRCYVTCDGAQKAGRLLLCDPCWRRAGGAELLAGKSPPFSQEDSAVAIYPRDIANARSHRDPLASATIAMIAFAAGVGCTVVGWMIGRMFFG